MARHQKRVSERDAGTTTAAAAAGEVGGSSATTGGAWKKRTVRTEDVAVVVNVALVALSQIWDRGSARGGSTGGNIGCRDEYQGRKRVRVAEARASNIQTGVGVGGGGGGKSR